MSCNRRPPRLVHFILSVLVPRKEREYFLGDLEESHARRRGERDGRPGSRSWVREFTGALELRFLARGTLPRARRDGRRKGDNMLRELTRDLRFGLRMMARSPGFTTVALVTMALGVGANTAMFSVVNGVLLKPLPYPEAGSIVFLMENNLSRGWDPFTISPFNFWDWREQNRSLELVAAYRTRTVTYTGGDRPLRLSAYLVSEEYLAILGGEPVLGRGFNVEDMDPHREGVVLLDHGLWQQFFGGDPEILGRSMVLDGEPHTVIGILPVGWRHPFNRSGMELLLPLRREAWWGRSTHFLWGLARMKPGVTVEQAQADLSSVASVLEGEYPETNSGWGASVRSLDGIMLGQSRPQLLILLASVGLVLLIACVNVAQMSLARGSGRRHEMAIRTALGAGRARIVRLLLAESILLSVVGGALGVLLALACLKAFQVGWSQILPRMEEISVNHTVLLFTAGLSLTSGLLFGLLPALSVAASNLGEALRTGGWSITGDASRSRLRAGMVVVEMSLAVVLLVGSGLLIRSLVALRGEDPGFEAEGRLALSTPLPRSEYPTNEERRAYGEAVLERVAAVPGVESAAITTLIPVSGQDEIWGLEIEGRPQSGPEDDIAALFYRVSPGYFETMGIPLRLGREFTPDDGEGKVRVAVVSESFVQAHFPREDPVGKRIRLTADDGPPIEIVGVAGDVQHYRLGQTSMPQLYIPFAQRPDADVGLVVKASVPPLTLVGAVRNEIQTVDPDMPVQGVRTLEQIIAADVSTPRFRTMLLTAFGLTALLLALVGLYGVMSYTVAQRSREIGMRMALGAPQSSILRLVLRDGVPMVAAGTVVGLGGALALTRVLESMLFGVGVRDPAVFAAVPLLLSVVAVVAILIPAVRATRVDPVKTLAPE
ncbi:MAG: ABC transporter permease [Gemmatimonadota bacterium]|nr:MAG: ABC transporter permease [Gemmatimonadota bacterium]